MFYHDQCKTVVTQFKKGLITKKEAYDQLTTISKKAYVKIPDAEPDGDISYCVVSAADEIDNIDNN